jgi:hypothetical protein
MVADGRATVIVERETNEDLLRYDRRLDGGTRPADVRPRIDPR